MKVAVACDHRGFAIKQRLLAQISDRGHKSVDFGTDSTRACDYPDFGLLAVCAVAAGQFERGILIDGSGIGMSILANKFPGIRAAICHDELTAEISRRHNNANILCIAADLLGDELIRRLVDSWLLTPFEEGRHSRRLEKISELERQICSPTYQEWLAAAVKQAGPTAAVVAK